MDIATHAPTRLPTAGLRSLLATLLAGLLAMTAAPATAMGDDAVARSTFTVSMEGREPGQPIEAIGPEHDRIYYFTELHGLEGRTVEHRWRFRGETLATVRFEIGGPRWRVYSSKRLVPTFQGDWTVEVVDEDGDVLHRDHFRYLTADDL